MSKKLMAWMQIAPHGNDDVSKQPCPSCGSKTIKALYKGNLSTRTGEGTVWCDSCRDGIHISQMKFGKGETFLDEDSADTEAVFDAIGKIRHVF